MVIKNSNNGIVKMLEGVSRQNLAAGEKTHMVKFFLDKGGDVPVHSHIHEQTGYLVNGKVILTIDGAEHELGAGDSWTIPGGINHGAEPIEDSVLIEVFSPPRDDYLESQ
jgi:quercetin dioxygenase-like cupin family protein